MAELGSDGIIQSPTTDDGLVHQPASGLKSQFVFHTASALELTELDQDISTCVQPVADARSSADDHCLLYATSSLRI